MKKILLLILLAGITLPIFSQTLTLTGTVKNPAYEPVELNIPFDGAYHQSNSIYCKPSIKGGFKFVLKGNQPKFVRLRYKKQERYLLLTPGKPIYANFNADDMAGTLTIIGNAKVYNQLVLKSALSNQTLLVNKLSDYKKWSADSLTNIMLPAIDKELNASLKDIAKSLNPATVKAALRTELEYYYANSLLQFTRSIMSKMSRQTAWKKVEDMVIEANALPTPAQIAVSPEANTYLHGYTLHQFKEIGLSIREKPTDAKNIIEQQTGMQYDTAMRLTSQFGEDYLLALIANKYLPKNAAEKLLANMTLHYTDTKEVKFAKQLQHDLSTNFSYSQYLKITRERISTLEQVLAENERNKDVVFLPADTKITNLKDLVAPYKGKAVYVDIWGTWCGPCVEELVKHSADLKKKFKDKNIIFLYLEMDYDKDTDKWKEFVNVHNLTGYHARASKEQMESVWIDMLNTRDVPRIFPTYVIFDTQGNLVNKNAKRPSDGEALYSQLEAAMNK